MRVSRMRTPFTFTYSLTGGPLQEVAEAKYLGCTLSDDLEWTKCIQNITAKGNGKLAFLRSFDGPVIRVPAY